MSKDVKPKQRIGQTGPSRAWVGWVVGLAVVCGAGYGAYRYTGTETKVEVPVAKVRKGEFIISVRTRGEIRSVNSKILTAPQVPDLRIVRLAESGKPIKAGQIVVEFDAAQLEQSMLERNTSIRTVDSEGVQLKASHKMVNELDSMNVMTSEYNVERSKLEASKAEVVSEIEGKKNRIDVGIAQGSLQQVQSTVKSHNVAQDADLSRLGNRRDKAVRDLDRTKGYLGNMVIRAPSDGMVNVLPNFRTQGSFGSTPPPFKEGDQVWTGAAIAEIPDLSKLRIELKLDEVDRGKLQLGQELRVRVDAVPDKEFFAELDWISPIATVMYKGMGLSEKTFPAFATLRETDPRLRPGMSSSVEVIIERESDALMIPARASVSSGGKPAVYLQRGEQFLLVPIEVGKRNDSDIVVLKGVKAGDQVALENPADAAKRAKKL